MKDQNRKKKTTVGDVIFRMVFWAARVVFCYCAFRLVTIFLAYKAGNDEYSALNEQYVDDSFEFGSGSGGQSDENGSGGDSAGARREKRQKVKPKRNLPQMRRATNMSESFLL